MKEVRYSEVASRLGLAVVVAVLMACSANYYTVGRRTELPNGTEEGVAIHLDAAQRLVIYRAKKYCAEPSPDAVKAVAAALSLGRSRSGSTTDKLEVQLEETVDQLGVRTQTVAIMRDALYRICEAYNNEKLNKTAVAALLQRSQDLTAAILAIDQLTSLGTASAQQDKPARLATRLATHAELLLAARETENTRQEEVQESTEAKAEATIRLAEATTREDEARAAYEEALETNKESEDEETNGLKVVADEAKAATDEAKKGLSDAESALSTAQDELTEAQGVTRALESAYQAALSEAVSAAARSDGPEGGPGGGLAGGQVTGEVARVVESIVAQVFGKDHLLEACAALLLSSDPEAAEREICVELVAKKGVEELGDGRPYAPDELTDVIKSALNAEPELRDRLRAWLRGRSLQLSVTELLYSDYPELRRQAVDEFSLDDTSVTGDAG